MVRFLLKLNLLVSITLFLSLMPSPQPAYAQWPPFNFRLIPSYENSQIKYNLTFFSQVEWPLGDLTIKILLPEGTRFVEAKAQDTLSTNFDGAEITFFSSFLDQPIRDTSFVVEVIDPTKTVFTTHAWISWQGEQPGDYLTQEVSIDITRQLLNWQEPPHANLQFTATATAADGVITYSVYPENVNWRRMWDVKINVPIPAGTNFLSAEASFPFVASFDGREVSFFAMELGNDIEVAPVRFKVSMAETVPPFIVTHAWASWKNVGRGVGQNVPLQEETRSGDIVVQANTAQQVVSDKLGDVPFANYDLTSIAIQNDGPNLKITLYLAGKLGPVGEPFLYYLHVDKDCRLDTGQQKNDLGRDYLIVYRNDKGRANFNVWDEAQKSFVWIQPLQFNNSAHEKMVTIWVPHDLLENSQLFCWQGQAKFDTDAFSPTPPSDTTTDARYETVTTTVTTTAQIVIPESPSSLWGYEDNPASSTDNSRIPLSATNLSGKLALPLDNGQALYDIHIFSLPTGQELVKIPNARQPNFHFDGQRLLINREGGGVENVFEYNLVDGTERQISNAPQDSYPFYNPWGNGVTYGNPELIIGANGSQSPFIFVQCSLLPPNQEVDQRCKDIVRLGVLVPAGQMGEIQGTHPVWTSTNMIAYKGCNTWAGARLCGIYIVSSTSTKGFSDGFIPRQLTRDTSDIPSDSKGNLITFTSHRDGNWEAYVMDLNGDGVTNLSNSPASSDGLPTLSPDGNWVAFVSDRDGRWAIWVASVGGSSAQKLFDLPVDVPWGDGDRAWTNERMSWGP